MPSDDCPEIYQAMVDYGADLKNEKHAVDSFGLLRLLTKKGQQPFLLNSE